MTDKELLALLKLAATFAGVDDVRKYLNNVLIRNVNNACHVVASDGYKFIKITINNYQTELPELLDVKSIKDAIRINNIAVIKKAENSSNYPDYERLIPKENNAHDLPSINVLYLAQAFSAISVASKAFNFKSHFRLSFENISSENANVFSGNFNDDISFKVIIMPMRKD